MKKILLFLVFDFCVLIGAEVQDVVPDLYSSRSGGVFHNYIDYVGYPNVMQSHVDQSFVAESIVGCTLIVGNRRGKEEGSYNPDEMISDVVWQNEADFSHTKSFPRKKVVSIDIRPSLSANVCHITGDFLQLPFKPNSQECVMFEWFPSINRCSSKNCYPEYEPLLYKAVCKAFTILAPGGLLIIDHIPYSIRLPNSAVDALKVLKNAEIFDKFKGYEQKRTKGIISLLQQEFDPFTLSMSMQECQDILSFLAIPKGVFFRPVDMQTNLEAIIKSIQVLKYICNRKDITIKNEIIEDLSTEIQAHKLGLKHSSSGNTKMFRWIYWVSARGSKAVRKIEEIGFNPLSTNFLYYPVNPYNQRLHAWVLMARKSLDVLAQEQRKVSTTDAATSGGFA